MPATPGHLALKPGHLALKPGHLALKRAAMAAATAFTTVNIWTGAPLLALWIGSQAVGTKALSMGAVGLVVVVLGVEVFALAVALSWLNNVYDETRWTTTHGTPREVAPQHAG